MSWPKQRGAAGGCGLSAEYPMHILNFDFQFDLTSCGRHLRFFFHRGEYTRNALVIVPRRSFTTLDVVGVPEGIIAETSIGPAYVRYDNGPEALSSCCATLG